jgi:hypothetical protein
MFVVIVILGVQVVSLKGQIDRIEKVDIKEIKELASHKSNDDLLDKTDAIAHIRKITNRLEYKILEIEESINESTEQIEED